MRTISRDEFLEDQTHPRKKLLAEMVFDGASDKALLKEGFNSVVVMEMKASIVNKVDKDDVPFKVAKPKKKTTKKTTKKATKKATKKTTKKAK